jgi:hypothetical protein
MVLAMIGAGGKTYSNFKLSLLLLLLLLPGARLGLNEGSVLCKLDHPAGVSPRPCKKMRAAGDDGWQEEAEAAEFALHVALAIIFKEVFDAAVLVCGVRRDLLSTKRVQRERDKPIMRNSQVLTTPLDR